MRALAAVIVALGLALPMPAHGAGSATSNVATGVQAASSTADPDRPAICTRALLVLGRAEVDARRFAADDLLVIGSWTVRPRAQSWRAMAPRHPMWTMVFHSSAWLIPDDTTGLEQAVTWMEMQARANPDRGRAAATSASGWQEGQVTKRLNTALCLYGWARDAELRERLEPVIEGLVAAALDPLRYAGPPRRRPHNHGLMADRALLDASRALDRPEWAARARERVALQFKSTFDECGMVREQSASYLRLHIRLWEDIARWIGEPVSDQVLRQVVRSRSLLRALTRPDGRLEFIGDGRELRPGTDGAAPRAWCPETGWYARTWTVGKSGLTQHAVVRFGPRMRGHGHADHGATTWWVGSGADGVAVLTDRGMHAKILGSRLRYARSSAAHSTLQGIDGPSRAMTGDLRQDGHTVVLETRGTQDQDAQGEPGWTRRLDFVEGPPSERQAVLAVTDRLDSKRPIKVAQRFTLDPAWQQVGPGTFRTRSGWRLTVRCDAGTPVSEVVEHYPDKGHIDRALSVDCTGLLGGDGTALRATLTVRPPR